MPHLERRDLPTDLRPPVLYVVVATALDLLRNLGEALVLLPPQVEELLILL